MEPRPAKLSDELSGIVLERLRKIPECSVVESMTITPRDRRASHSPNWEAGFVRGGPGLTPSNALQVAREVAAEFDLQP